MEPDDTIDELRDKDSYTVTDVEQLQRLAVKFPNSARLWDFLGDVSQLASESPVDYNFARECYEAAIAVDPKFGPAHNSLGYWLDINEEYALAARHFELAVTNGEGTIALLGLARVLAQMGDEKKAIDTLGRCSDQAAPAVVKLRLEIGEGLWKTDALDEHQ